MTERRPTRGGPFTGGAEDAGKGPESRHMHVYFLAGAAIVRLLGINSASIWFDEAISRFRASVSLMDYMRYFSDYTGTNLWEVMLRPFAVGPVWMLRIPSLVAAVLALWLAARIMDRLEFTRGQWITAAIPLALLPGLIWQAQDARYYAAVGAIYMAGIWFALQGRGLGLLACMGLLPYLHPIGLAYSLGLFCVGIICGMGAVRSLWIGGVSLISWLPRIYQILSTQALPGLQPVGAGDSGRTEFWLREVTPLYAVDHTGQALVVDSLDFLCRLLVVALVLFVVAVAATRIAHKTTRITLAAAAVPIIALFAMAMIQPVYFYRPVQPDALPLCLLIGLILAPGPKWMSKIAPAFGLILLAISVANWNPSARGGYIDKGADAILRNWHAGDKIAYASLTVAMPFQYYLPDKASCLIPGNDMGDLPPALRTMDECDEYAGAGTWIVVPRDPTLNEDVAKELNKLTAESLPAWWSDIAWQFAPIEIFYLQ